MRNRAIIIVGVAVFIGLCALLGCVFMPTIGLTPSFLVLLLTAAAGSLLLTWAVWAFVNEIVKKYAVVDCENYNLVTVGDTLEECKKEKASAQSKNEGAVSDVKFITSDGNTATYILVGSTWYRKDFEESNLYIKAGDVLSENVQRVAK